MTDDEKRKQVADQCRVVSHLCKALIEVHDDYARMFDAGAAAELIDSVGRRTAERMETLGDILNGMDAVEESDRWVDPVFKKAHELWTSSSAA